MLTLEQTMDAHRGKGWSVTWDPTGTKLASCGEDKVVNVWRFNPTKAEENQNNASAASPEAKRPEPWTFLTKFGDENHQRSVRSIAWSPCGKFVVIASFDAQVTLWEVRSTGGSLAFECVSVVEGHENEVKSVSWSPSGKYFASSGRDKNVMIWTMLTEGDIDVECAGVMTTHTQDVKRVVWHPHEDILASASYDDTIKMYINDIDDGDWASTATLTGHTSTVWAIDFDATGNRIASCSDDKTVKIWQRSSENKWSCACTLAGYHTRSIYDISWNKNNGLIATACGDNNIRIFKETSGVNELDKNNFELVCTVKGHKADINSAQWNPELEGVLASTSDDGTVKVWTWKDAAL